MIRIFGYELGRKEEVASRLAKVISELEKMSSLGPPNEHMTASVVSAGNYGLAEDTRHNVRNLAGFWLEALMEYSPRRKRLIGRIKKGNLSVSLGEIEADVNTAYKRYLEILESKRDLSDQEFPDLDLSKKVA